jgi:hypothetical protein
MNDVKSTGLPGRIPAPRSKIADRLRLAVARKAEAEENLLHAREAVQVDLRR